MIEKIDDEYMNKYSVLSTGDARSFSIIINRINEIIDAVNKPTNIQETQSFNVTVENNDQPKPKDGMLAISVGEVDIFFEFNPDRGEQWQQRSFRHWNYIKQTLEQEGLI